MDTFARSVVEKFLREKGCVPYGSKINGVIAWIKDDAVIIQLPVTGRIDSDQFEFIATEQLDVGAWEYDYWLGQNT